MAEMLSLLFHTGPPGNPEHGSANCNDSQAGEQSDRAPAREPRAIQPGPQPHRGCRGHPSLSTCAAEQALTQSLNSMGRKFHGALVKQQKEQCSPIPEFQKVILNWEYILNSALVRICLVSSTLVSI